VLTGLRLHQIKCFTDLSLTFGVSSGPSPSRWTILVGPNGVGKTTILQAIALAAIDPSAVSALVEAPWTLARVGATRKRPPSIQLSYKQGTDQRRITRSIPIDEGLYVRGGKSQRKGRPLIIGFAARRRIARRGESPPTTNLEVNRVRGFFDTDQPLLRDDPTRIFPNPKHLRALASNVRQVLLSRLQADGARLFPLLSDAEFGGKKGLSATEALLIHRRVTLRYGRDFDVQVALQDLADGYQAMVALVVEILVQGALARRRVPNPHYLDATVLIDEIETHLHPAWQKSVVPLLRQVFPRCQFIVTTHSPLVLGTARRGEVHVLEVAEEGAVRQEVLETRLSMFGAERIYEEVFGVFRSAPDDLVADERRYLDDVAQTGRRPEPHVRASVEGAWQDAERRATDADHH